MTDTTTSTHGLAQSQAHASAARRLAHSKRKLAELRVDEYVDPQREEALIAEVEDRETALKAAYVAYTNPFKVVKTI